ncbi:hypothetical protein [Pontibacter anaerobius]|uniref:Outer membrane protein beta-barrel domain-containing protein n=1 Tax=Pontibacter anaerobius TaxID=2993940 RepID=A0ABT3RII6_9BACT|nr:hypothetical protein [Pontibacter anaerobius]MCX2741629.1 hypothetical protein [Pontibacter anaerobius]
MKTTLPLIILLFLCVSAFGQAKFEKGYYITVEGDSIQGYIKNEDWNRNPENIEFKSSSENNSSQMLPLKQVQRFGFEDGDKYETFAVDVDVSPTNLNELVTNASPTIVRDTVMLRVLVKGTLNLFGYTDKSSKTHFYVSKGGEEPRELLYQRVKRNNNDKVGYLTLDLYKGLLSYYLSDCESVQSRVQKVEFKQSQLAALVAAYNACVNPGAVATEPEKEIGKLKLGVIGGFTALNYSFKSGSSSFNNLVNSDFNGQGVTAGLAVNYTLPRAHGKWAIANELMLKPYVAKGHYESSTETSDTEFKLLYLGLNSMVRYAFTTGAFRPFVSVGLANNLMLSDNSRQQRETSRYGTVRQYDEKPLDEVRKYEQAILLGAGVFTDKYAAEARLEKGNGFSFYTALESSKTTLTLQLTYFLR